MAAIGAKTKIRVFFNYFFESTLKDTLMAKNSSISSSLIYTPNQDNEHSCPHMGALPGIVCSKISLKSLLTVLHFSVENFQILLVQLPI